MARVPRHRLPGMDIERLGIVGGGQMGAGIAEVASLAGVEVVVVEDGPERAAATLSRIERSLAKGVERGKLEESVATAAQALVGVETDLDALADRQLVVEAIPEDEAAKLVIFGALDGILADADAVLASNTSSIPIMKLALGTSRPQAVIGLHFFNPVPVMELVEVIPSLLTSVETLERARSFGCDVGKRVVTAPDRAGFIVNALLIPYLLDAIRMHDAGRATVEDIDTAMRFGANHPMGPLALCDLIGNDTMLLVADAMYDELREERLAAPPLLRRMVEAGRLGRKTGAGFYDYAR